VPLEQELNDLLKDAMKQKDLRTADVVRMIKTKVMERRTAKGFSGQVDDALVREVIAAYAKQLRKAIEEYRALGDKPGAAEQVSQLEFEVSFCDRFLPRQMDEAALRVIVQEAVTRLGLKDPKQVGRVVGEVMKAHKGQAEACDVTRIAAAILSAAPPA
jgi:uncharacterized protein